MILVRLAAAIFGGLIGALFVIAPVKIWNVNPLISGGIAIVLIVSLIYFFNKKA